MKRNESIKKWASNSFCITMSGIWFGIGQLNLIQPLLAIYRINRTNLPTASSMSSPVFLLWMRASFYAGSAFAFVGLTFPQSGMSALAKAWSNLLPLTHYLHVFLEQTFRGADLADSAPDMLLLCGFVPLGLLLTPQLKRYLTDSRYWGRP